MGSQILYELKVVREPTGYTMPKRFTSAQDVFQGFRERYIRLDREEFSVILLDNKHKMLDFNVISVGSLTSSIVHPREVFKAAILTNAAAILLIHNHPAGDPTPSPEDVEVTKLIKEVGEIMKIKVLDHVIFGQDSYFSFSEKGML